MVAFFAHPGWHVDRVARGESAQAWRAALERFDGTTAATLKEDGGDAVYAASLLGQDVVVKRWDLTSLGSRLKAIFRAGRADRHWRNAAWLRRAGIRTAHCLALATEYRRGSPRRWLVMKALDGKTVLEHVADGQLGPKREHALAAALGEQVAYLEACGRGNRDHKPSNLIAAWEPEGPEVAIIDCVAIQRGVSAERMLASLLIEPTGCGVPLRRALLMRVVTSFALETLMYPNRRATAPGTLRQRRNELWRRVAAIVQAHGDPRPRINPLSPQRPALKSPR